MVERSPTARVHKESGAGFKGLPYTPNPEPILVQGVVLKTGNLAIWVRCKISVLLSSVAQRNQTFHHGRMKYANIHGFASPTWPGRKTWGFPALSAFGPSRTDLSARGGPSKPRTHSAIARLALEGSFIRPHACDKVGHAIK